MLPYLVQFIPENRELIDLEVNSQLVSYVLLDQNKCVTTDINESLFDGLLIDTKMGVSKIAAEGDYLLMADGIIIDCCNGFFFKESSEVEVRGTTMALRDRTMFYLEEVSELVSLPDTVDFYTREFVITKEAAALYEEITADPLDQHSLKNNMLSIYERMRDNTNDMKSLCGAGHLILGAIENEIE